MKRPFLAWLAFPLLGLFLTCSLVLGQPPGNPPTTPPPPAPISPSTPAAPGGAADAPPAPLTFAAAAVYTIGLLVIVCMPSRKS